MRVAITGSSGFIGWHLRCLLHEKNDIEVIEVNEEEFSDSNRLEEALLPCDAVFHLAGMNRGNDDDVFQTNVELAQLLVESIGKTRTIKHIVYSNSVQQYNDSPYGSGKRKAAEILRRFADKTGASMTDVILPNIFGEHGKPFYNSVAATFCHQLSREEEPEIIKDNQIDLLHVRNAVEVMYDSMVRKINGDVHPQGTELTVSELLITLQNIDLNYRKGVIPDLSRAFDLELFNTYRCFLFPEFYPHRLELKSDDRGWLFEFIRSNSEGQAFASSTKPGITRGNHYHVRKFERFLVIQGEATLHLRRLLTDDVITFTVNGDEPSCVDIPTLHTHNITNKGNNDLLTLFWAGELFDVENPDTFQEVV
jgi:UDP-2-acetamido-2,6-beta-L-arabino-hexul-4-ose reductase